MKKIFTILLFITSLLTAQTLEMQTFPFMDPIDNNIPESFIVEGAENELIMFWIDSTDLHMSKSLDEGTNWNTPITLVDNTPLLDSLTDLNALKLNNGRIFVTYKFKFHYLIYSDDNGQTWSEPVQLVTDIGIIRPRKVYESSLSQTDDNKIWFVYNRQNVIYNIQSDDGINWTEKDTMLVFESGSPHYSSVNSHWNNSLVLIYQYDLDDTSDICELISVDSGKTWNDPRVIFDDGINKKRPRVFKDSNKNLWLTFNQAETTPFEEYYQNNIYYSKLPDGAYSWGIPNKFTKYVDFDGWQNLSFANNKPYIAFTSNRALDGYSLWYGIADESNDDSAVPAIFNADFRFQNDYPKANVNINTKVYSHNALNSIMFYYTISNALDSIQLFDDGLHNDKEADDFIFGNDIIGLSYRFWFDYFVSASDQFGNVALTSSKKVSSPFTADGGDAFIFDNNNLWLPINSRGVLTDVVVSGAERSGGWFDEARVIFSSGFALSGYTNGNLWANGMMSASRIKDYIHGTIDSSDAINFIHVVRSSQPDFYQSWDDWKDAVNQGADFYDGDGDGIYNPVDKNSNGNWDENEDKPSVIGDITAFTVFNDGVDPSLRNFNNVEPQGIEIKQTVFSYNKATSPKLANVLFVKYKIENMGTVADILDSVYFGAWADQDIGKYFDDLIGTDSTLNASYSYNDGEDEEYGINPPASFISFIQGPPVYIEGETFIDENGNGIYDDGLDTALDTAINRKGELVGLDNYPGARNNKLTANIHYMSGNLNLGDPDNEAELRYYMLGYDQQGDLIDPCNWEFGQVFNEDCSTINSRLLYSGDPVTQNGWINNMSYDQRQLGSTGPFDLVKGSPIEIIVAYTIGRGTDHLTSITEARRITNDAIEFYNTNFSYVPVGVKESVMSRQPTEYLLSQNYPNPFNPSTKISFSLPSESKVKLQVFNTLGEIVTTLVDATKAAGVHQLEWNATNLASGVYLYRINAESVGDAQQFNSVRKMILLK